MIKKEICSEVAYTSLNSYMMNNRRELSVMGLEPSYLVYLGEDNMPFSFKRG